MHGNTLMSIFLLSYLSFKSGFKLLLQSRLLIFHFSEIILKGHFLAFKVLRDDSLHHHCLTDFKIKFPVTVVHFDLANEYPFSMCCNGDYY